jgi:tyrosine-specific transport protein
MKDQISIIKGVFVFAATIIGAGILALPVAAATTGLVPMLLILLVVGGVSVFSALYIAETVINTKGDHHLPSLAGEHLGNLGFAVMISGIVIYIYGALVGYLAAGGQLLHSLSNGKIPVPAGILIYGAAGSFIVHFGLKIMSRVETYLFSAMLILIGIVIALTLPNIKIPLLMETHWSDTLNIFGVVLFAYVGHSVIPSIARGLKKQGDINRISIWGVLIPLLLYLVWCVVVIGAIPKEALEGRPSLANAKITGQPATIPLGLIVGGSVIILGNLFAVISTMTSYIGFGFSLKEAYVDVATAMHQKISSFAATFLVVIPPLVIALFKPEMFVNALDIAGTYGGGLFVGILPVLMVLKSRKKIKPIEQMTWGGQWMPYIVLIIYLIGMFYGTIKLIF